MTGRAVAGHRGRIQSPQSSQYLPRILLPIILLAFALSGCNGTARSSRAPFHVHAGAQTRHDKSVHVFVIVMENKGSSQILGNANAPFINRLARRYAFAANYWGVRHPSLPNYVAMIAGTTYGQSSDDEGQRFAGQTVAGQISRAGLTWRGYMESMPRPGFDGNSANSGLYRRKHDPFMLMTAILDSPKQVRNVVPGSNLARNLKDGHVANLSFITPNMCHDMHGLSTVKCPSSVAGLIKTGDRYLSRVVPQITASPAWTNKSVLFIVWDEDDGFGGGPPGFQGGRVPALVIAKAGKRHFVSHGLYDHYSMLKTIQGMLGLGCLQNTCRGSTHQMTEFLHK